MKLLIGLGNYGKKYARNRHNIGFMAIEEIAKRYGIDQWRDRFQSKVGEGMIGRHKCLLVKPQTYMNNSGHAAQQAVQFFKLDLADVYVFHDEIDITPGKIKVKTGGGDAGHNGLKSMTAQIGSDYHRIRFGVGRPAEKSKVPGYVLKDFASRDQDWLDPLLHNIAEHIELLLDDRKSDFISKVGVDVAPKATPSTLVESEQNSSKGDSESPLRKPAPSKTTGPGALGAALADWLKGKKT